MKIATIIINSIALFMQIALLISMILKSTDYK